MNFRKTAKCACISYYLAIIPPRIYATISVIKNSHHYFLKMRGGDAWMHKMFFFFNSTIVLILIDINWYYLAYASLHKCDYIHYKKNCNIIFQKWGGGVKGSFEFFQKFIRFGSRTLPLVLKVRGGWTSQKFDYQEWLALDRWLIFNKTATHPLDDGCQKEP